MNSHEYWQAIRGVQAELPEHLHMCSVNKQGSVNRPGQIVLVSAPTAARYLVDGTHRPATEAEIAEFHAQQKAAAEEIGRRDAEARNRITPELMATVAAAAARAVMADGGKKAKGD